MTSKINQICQVIDNQHCMGTDGLRDYYAARHVRNFNLKKNPIERFVAIQKELKNYNVRVSLKPDERVHLYAYETKAEVTL